MTTSAERVKLAALPEKPARSRIWLLAGIAVLLGLSAWRMVFAPVESPASITEIAGAAMGTTYSVKLASVLRGAEHERVKQAVSWALTEVDGAASTYRQDSELARFNQLTDTATPFPLSPVLLPIVEVALQVGAQSEGALDVTIAPLVDTWGFGPSSARNPSEQTIEALRAKVGLPLLQLEGSALKKQHTDLKLDLSAVAKGYTVDRIASALQALGQHNFLVEVGGELKARGLRPDGRPWRVGIEKPLPGARAVERVVALHDMAMATSGDYRNFYEVDGQRRSHLIDPRTGRPIEHDLVSVTVLHPEAARADAWATALAVLGPTAGPELAEREGLSAFFVVREGPEAFRSIESRAFRAAPGAHP